jgi:hypothetical protein
MDDTPIGAAAESPEEQPDDMVTSDEEQPDDMITSDDDMITSEVKKIAQEKNMDDAQVARYDNIAHQIYAVLMINGEKRFTVPKIILILKAFGANAGTRLKPILAVHFVKTIFIKMCEFDIDTFIEVLKTKAAELTHEGKEETAAAITAVLTAVEGIEPDPNPDRGNDDGSKSDRSLKHEIEAYSMKTDPFLLESGEEQYRRLKTAPGFQQYHNVIDKMHKEGSFYSSAPYVKEFHQLQQQADAPEDALSGFRWYEAKMRESSTKPKITPKRFRLAFSAFLKEGADKETLQITQDETLTPEEKKQQLQTLQSRFEDGESDKIDKDTHHKLMTRITRVNKELFAMISAEVDKLDVPAPASAESNLGGIFV